ncbi:MAG: divalent-cation tolerance protein CutA [Candidatus Kapaibacteriales bacterium]
MNEEIVVLFVTIDDYEKALQISRIVVHEKLCACSSILQNITSIFEWDNKINERNENLIVLKTSKDRYKNLISRVKELHPDKVPEIIVLPVIDGFSEYMSWVLSVTNPNIG